MFVTSLTITPASWSKFCKTGIFEIGMKIFIQKGIAVILLLVVLSASMGFNVFSHSCSSSGLSEVSLAAIDACCATPASSGESADDGCCTTSHVLVKMELPAVAPAGQVAVNGPDFVPLPALHTLFKVPYPTVMVAAYPVREAPPLCPPDAQAVFSVYLI
jgi:hypothetical protein